MNPTGAVGLQCRVNVAFRRWGSALALNYTFLATPELLEISSRWNMLEKRQGKHKDNQWTNLLGKELADNRLGFASNWTIQPATIVCSLPILCTRALCICGYYLAWTRLVLTNKATGSFDFCCVRGQRGGVICPSESDFFLLILFIVLNLLYFLCTVVQNKDLNSGERWMKSLKNY